MIGWEDIVNEFLEGGLMRADVESLRWKIELPMEARKVIDQNLRLVDDLGAAAGSMTTAAARAAIERISAAVGREEAAAPAHWRWEGGLPVAGRMGELSSAEDVELAGRLTELGPSLPMEAGALERLLSKIRQSELPGETDQARESERGAMRIYPEGAELTIDALAASKDVLEPETLPGGDEPKRTE